MITVKKYDLVLLNSEALNHYGCDYNIEHALVLKLNKDSMMVAIDGVEKLSRQPIHTTVEVSKNLVVDTLQLQLDRLCQI